MKVLIVGDSFAADWSVKYHDSLGWPNLLARQFTVTNLAQAGVSEYRIYKQITSIDLAVFDYIIVCHTSPHRLVTKRHPVHANDKLHSNADLIFADVEFHARGLRSWFDRSLSSAYDFFQYHYDEDYGQFVYDRTIECICRLLTKKSCVHLISPLATSDVLGQLESTLVFDSNHFQPNLTNHLSPDGNIIVFEKLTAIIHANRTV